MRLLRIQLYAYLDDRLIVGDTEVEATQSIQETLQVLIHAGFIVNLKSELALTQDLVYIGAWFRMELDRLYLPKTRIQVLTACARSFSKVGAYRPAHQFLSLLGLMAATLQSVEYVHIHMLPIQWYLKLVDSHNP